MRIDELAARRRRLQELPYVIEVYCDRGHKPWSAGQFEPREPETDPEHPDFVLGDERAWVLTDYADPVEGSTRRERRNLRGVLRSQAWVAADGHYIADDELHAMPDAVYPWVAHATFRLPPCPGCRYTFERLANPLWDKLDQLMANSVVAISLADLDGTFRPQAQVKQRRRRERRPPTLES